MTTIRMTAAELRRLGMHTEVEKDLARKPGRPAMTVEEQETSRRCLFQLMCEAHGLPEPLHELEFHPSRKWRFDWAWEAERVALEIDGGSWTQGRHTRGKGFQADIEKLNAATLMGWRVLRCTPAQVKSGEIFALLKELLAGDAG